MKTLSSALNAHLQQEVTTLALCWKLTRTDSVVMGFTTADRDIVLDGVTYQASTGFAPGDLESNAQMEDDRLLLEGLLHTEAITDQDVTAGVYDFADIEIFMVNYMDLTQGKVVLRTGIFGEVTYENNQFSVEIHGKSHQMNRTIGQLYSPLCRAELGDSACGVALAGYTRTGTVTQVLDAQTLEDTALTDVSGFFDFGVVTFTSGANQGKSMEVRRYINDASSPRFTLALPMPEPVQVGDGYSIVAGCDKKIATCKARFNNILNFRGEPHVPGMDRMLNGDSTPS